MIPGVQYICVHQCGLEKWGAAWHANAEMCCGSFWRGIGAQLHCLYVQAPRVQVFMQVFTQVFTQVVAQDVHAPGSPLVQVL